MAFSTTTKQAESPASHPLHRNTVSDVLLGMMLLSLYGAQMSKKALRKLKRKLFFASLKLKLKSLFKPRDFSDRELLYIIAGAILLTIIILSPVVGLVLLLIALLLVLGGVF